MRTLILTLATTLLLTPAVQAADAAAGKAKAVTCAACHGADGKATLPNHPNLAGQRADYLELSLKAYRDGARPHPVMGAMAKPLSDADIANLAAYFSSLPPG